jgi:hypothetical protein
MSGEESVRDDGEVLAVLRSIDRRLALLTGAQERDVRKRLINEILRTPARIKMYDAIDGGTGSPDLARLAGAKERTAQSLVQELRDLGLVKVAGSTIGRGFTVAKDDEAVLQWYLRLVAGEDDAASITE